MERTENQKTVATWASQTFGDGGTDVRCAWRVIEELVEGGRALTAGKPDGQCATEIADAAIVLLRLADRLGEDLIGWSIGVRPLDLPKGRDGAHAAVTIAMRDMGTLAFLLVPIAPGARPDPKRAGGLAARVWNWLRQACECLDHDLDERIDAKMVINRARVWRVEGGHGYHVRDKTIADVAA